MLCKFIFLFLCNEYKEKKNTDKTRSKQEKKREIDKIK